MAISIIGRKVGMTRVFTDAGEAIPVTVIECEPNRVTQVKTPETDGYSAIQVTVGTQKVSRLTQAAAGHFKKAGVEPGRGLWEIRVGDDAIADYAFGAEVRVDAFADIKSVDVTGTSIGKGFAGGMKRWGFKGVAPRTATPCHTALRVRLASASHRAKYSKTKRWPDRWGTSRSPP